MTITKTQWSSYTADTRRLEQTSEQQTVGKDQDEMESFGVHGVVRQPRCIETSAIITLLVSKLLSLCINTISQMKHSIKQLSI